MKLGIIVLVILGLAAAACAAVLMGALNSGSSASGSKQPESIEIAMAKVPLPAGTVITNEDIVMDMVSRDQLPEGSFISPLQILGSVLAMPVVEGQILVKSCFLKEGIGALLASQIPHGMRGVSVTITSKIMPDSILLYPGCVVDVLVCYKLPNSSDGAEALAQTMLVGIHVLAVSGDSVVSKPVEEGGAKKSSSSRGGRLVTLLVNPNQAEALMLAVGSGELSMTLRNPLDKDPVDEEGSLLDRRSLGRKGETIQPTISNEQVLPEQRSDGDNPIEEGSEDGVPGTIGSVSQPESTNKSQNRKNSSLDIEMILGPVKKIENIDAPENITDKTAPKK